MKSDRIRAFLILGTIAAAVVAMSSLPAGAASKRRQCLTACAQLISACAIQNQAFGDLERACRATLLTRCREEGPGTCLGTTTTTTPTMNPTTTTTLRFKDNDDGTITDRQTGLIWEKKDSICPGIHCVSDVYTWSSLGSSGPDGTAFTQFLATLNGGVTGVGNCAENGITPMGIAGGFNGHCDWRLPSIEEMQTILFASNPCPRSPCIDAIFGPTAAAPEVDYWSSTAVAGFPETWVVDFASGRVFYRFNATGFVSAVRAVRGGS
jgi:hypothetical protein